MILKHGVAPVIVVTGTELSWARKRTTRPGFSVTDRGHDHHECYPILAMQADALVHSALVGREIGPR